MFFLPTVLLLSALSVRAIPTRGFASVLTTDHSALRDLPVGKTPISSYDMIELGRMAVAVNKAYCPTSKHLEPASLAQLSLRAGRHQRRTHSTWHTTSIVISGSDAEFEHLAGDVDINSRPPLAPKPIRHVEVIGHGLGSAVGLLLATALHLEVSGPAADAYENPLPPVEISATLFSLPRVGDQSFADWMDTLVETSNRKLRINRVTSFADTIAHLPERHLELAHPSLGEIWVGADPRVAYACRSASLHEESDVCSGSISLPRTSLLDHAGPFGGVWIGPRSCHRPKADPSAF